MNIPPLLPQGAELTHPPTRAKVYISLLLAFSLTLLPWMEQIRWLVPDFTLMLLLYWNIRAPRLAGIGMAFSLGLLTDVARGVLFGLNALAYCAATFIVLLVAPVVAFLIRKIARRLRGASRGAQTAMGEMNRVLDEAIGGHRVIKVYGGQAYEANRFVEAANEVRRFLLRQAATTAAV